MKLSVAVITWNRSKQLAEALESCFSCKLPQDTEFVIIDNASTDDTEQVVKSLFQNNKYHFFYEKMSENLGVGRGRNYAYLKSHGEYVYFLDDDAYIDKQNSSFFLQAIAYLDDNPLIATLTSQIYDLMWKANRVSESGPKFKEGLKLHFMFCGGSHFLRKSFWENEEPYFPNKYGYEEIMPSLRVADAGCLNVFATDLLVIHNPQVNKWNFDDEKNAMIVINELVCQKVMKTKLYPRIFSPILTLSYWVRAKKYLTKGRKKKADELIDLMENQYEYGKRIKILTVLKLWHKFGLSIF